MLIINLRIYMDCSIEIILKVINILIITKLTSLFHLQNNVRMIADYSVFINKY
jgi:hypothetical protein